MSRFSRTAIYFIASGAAISLYIALFPSLFAGLFAFLLVLAIVDYLARRNRNHVRSFNAALRSVCHQEGAIPKVSLAFSRSGPLSGACYEFTRRMMKGEPPLSAAVESGVPLQLRTAIALESPKEAYEWREDRRAAEVELATVDSTLMPVYGQFIYLIGTAFITTIVMVYLSVAVAPTLRRMLDEFGIDTSFEINMGIARVMSFSVLGCLSLFAMLSLAARFTVARTARWFPMTPRRAEMKSEYLRGLADGFDAGWPIDRTLEVARSVCIRPADRDVIANMIRWIKTGIDPINVLAAGGWLSAREAAWIDRSDPRRAAPLLRMIADQCIRDSSANLRWVMAWFYPIIIVLLGMNVAVIVIGFLGSLVGLIHGLS